MNAELKVADEVKLVRIDIGCGKNKREGFIGLDAIAFDGVDIVCDLRGRLPYDDDSVDEVHCSHFIEHLTWPERVTFLNELYRVMRKDAKCQLIWPHWASQRYYGDPTHKEPMSEFAMFYLDKAWREVNAPHCGYTCDFAATWGYSMRPEWQVRNQEAQMFALAWYKEVAQDVIATLTKR